MLAPVHPSGLRLGDFGFSGDSLTRPAATLSGLFGRNHARRFECPCLRNGCSGCRPLPDECRLSVPRHHRRFRPSVDSSVFAFISFLDLPRQQAVIQADSKCVLPSAFCTASPDGATAACTSTSQDSEGAKEKRRISLAVFGRGEQRGWWTELAATSPPTSANAGHLATAHCAPSLRSGLDAFRGSRWAIYRWAWQPRAEVAASSPISLSFQVLALSGREYFSPLVAVANSRFWKL
ncbi:hypothetical protein VTJ04DRAFT_5939 [Mycothermus thermophilus]|uniref:uncharacterized protein n=1 Tax=Humicola insolens TaxID=85995 RepID=UPI003743CA77